MEKEKEKKWSKRKKKVRTDLMTRTGITRNPRNRN